MTAEDPPTRTPQIDDYVVAYNDPPRYGQIVDHFSGGEYAVIFSDHDAENDGPHILKAAELTSVTDIDPQIADDIRRQRDLIELP